MTNQRPHWILPLILTLAYSSVYAAPKNDTPSIDQTATNQKQTTANGHNFNNVIGNIKISGISLADHENSLRRREKEIREEYKETINKLSQAQVEERVELNLKKIVLEKQLSEIDSQIANLKDSYEKRIAALQTQINDLKDNASFFSEDVLKDAQIALAKGDDSKANDLYTKITLLAKIMDKQVAKAEYQLGLIALRAINYNIAYPHFKEAVKRDENNADYLSKAGELASTLALYSEAEPLLKRALALKEKALGSEHPNVAENLNSLAELYRLQGQYQQAEPLYKHALTINENMLGTEKIEVAQSLNYLALLYDDQEKYELAESLYIRALDIWEKVLGPEHPDVASVLSNLAGLYSTQGKYAQAEPLYKRSLAIKEKTLGPIHPYVATDLNNLALHYSAQGKYAQAEPLYKRALEIWEKVLGPEHPEVATGLSNLARLYQKTNRGEEAELLLKRASQILALKR